MTEDPAQIEVSLPAYANGAAFKLMFATSFTAGQGDIMPLAVSVSETDPLDPTGGINVALRVFGFG
jgi:hypothetical protein